jgi:membrane protease YdiL (CAAX protease family)
MSMAGVSLLDKNRTFVGIVCLSAILLGALELSHLPLRFYVWELVFAVKVLLVAVPVFIYWHKSKSVKTVVAKLGLNSWSWKSSIAAFFSTLLLAGIAVGIGLALRKVAYSNLDNAATIAMAICFDIPAIAFFSMTTLLVEEIVFRGYYFVRLTQTRSIVGSILISSFVWTIFKSPELLEIEMLNIGAIVSFLFSMFSLGVLAAVLFRWLDSIWPTYFLRVGIAIFPAAILGNFAQNSDFFFESKSPWFYADGVVYSTLLLMVSLLIYLTKIRSKRIPSEAAHPD